GPGEGTSAGALAAAGAPTVDVPPVIAAEHVAIAPMGWRHELDGSAIADMIRTDVRSFSVEPDAHQPVWGTVYVPEGAPPGEYRGTLTVRAAGVEPVEIDLHLTVWDFTLPRFSTLETATWDAHALAAARAGRHEEHARMVIQHRWNANYLYLWDDGPLPLETMQRLTEQG